MNRLPFFAPRRRARRIVCCVAAVLPAACGNPPAAPHLTVTEVESPAGVGSGEPFLSTEGDTPLLGWIAPGSGGGRAVVFSRLVAGAWSTPMPIFESDSLVVNWADTPSLTATPDGDLWSHVLERTVRGGYAIRVLHSDDRGRTWSEPWTPHEDGTATEHGFLSAIPIGDGSVGLLWLDGRRFADAAGPQQTGLYFRAAGVPLDGGEMPVDERVCDCCGTDMAWTEQGIVAVYRDRSEGEVRDIVTARFANGSWDEPVLVHADGWETGACPINGPAIASDGQRLAVAWFTAADGLERVYVAFSGDSGRTFGDPVRIDEGTPAGRVDLVLRGELALVSWLERTGGDVAEPMVRAVSSAGRAGPSASVPGAGRASGYPRLTAAEGGTALLAWTDATEVATRVRTARVAVGGDGA